MPLLRIKINYRKIILDNDCSTEEIAVLRKDGEYRYLRFLGFITRDDAIALDCSLPVKLKVDAYAAKDDVSIKWTTIPTNKHLQGCLTARGVYGVITKSIPRIV